MKPGLPLLVGLVLSGAAVSPAFTPPALSQDLSDGPAPHAGSGFLSGFEIDQELDADVLLAVGDADAPDHPPYTDIRYRFEAETVRADGLRWGLRLGAGAVRHDGGRGAGGAVDCVQPCPPQGLVTGLYAAPGCGPADARAGIDRAELYIRHPYAELRAGVTGTAAALERPVRVRAFRLAGADGPLADPTGRTLADTGLSLTAPAPGVSVQSRRLAGFRAALSYTPRADPCGLDHCRPGPDDNLVPEIRDIWSAGLGFDRRRRATGVRWAAYAGGETGRTEGVALPEYDDPWTAGLAIVREDGGFTLSGRWLASNDGLSSGGYEATSISAAYQSGDWLYSVEAGLGESEAYGASAASFVIGASRLVGRNGLIGAGVQMTHHDWSAQPDDEAAVFLIEAGLRF